MPRIPLQLLSPRLLPHTRIRPLRAFFNHLRSPIPQPVDGFPHHRNYSTPNSPPPPHLTRPADLRSQLSGSPVAGTTAPPPRPKKSLRKYIYMTLFLAAGLYAGDSVRFMAAPRPLPLPGSREDKMLLDSIKRKAEKLPIIKSLAEDPDWTYFDAYEILEGEQRDHMLSTGPLGGARGLGGFQRIFYNAQSGECVVVIFIGGALAGWPTNTHGGAIATILDEAMGRCAIRKLPGHTGVTASLSLQYIKPVYTNSFYVVRATPVDAGSTEKKQNVHASVEDLNGTVLVAADALFVVPRNYKTQPLRRM